ncbi:hypothetical protein MMC27_005502 [Xylographa pallens]|nr:hypothetical protein [Xylographa pallens]
MTLSYRWGPRTSIELLESNVEFLQQGLHILQLPRTFQDAITIARQFSIQYLWIDALCIIQDSDSDWERESSTMCYVYSHSACNIAAYAAIDQHSGLFHVRRENEFLPGLVKPRASQASGPGDHFLLFDKGYWNRQLAQVPLSNRGWVFQECLLAPRVLYFTRNQILYECFREARCEGFPQGIPYHERSKDLTSLWNSIDTKKDKTSQPKSGQMDLQTHVLWSYLLKAYSLCKLTYSKDRLPAISGVERLFREVTGDECLFGLWRSRLIEQMVWRIPQPRPKPALEYNVPSWSWASTDGEVLPTGLPLDRRNLVTVGKIETYKVSEGRSGGARLACLTLTGILSVQRENRPMANNYNYIGSEAINAGLSLDNLDIDLSTFQEIYFLPVLTCHPWHPPQPSAARLVGLVLERVANTESASFKRVGHFTTDSCQEVEKLGFIVDIEGLAKPKIENLPTEIAIY